MPPFGNPLGGLIPVGRKSSPDGTPHNDGGADGSTTRQNSIYAYEGYNVTPTFSVAAENDEVLVLTAFGFPAGTTAQIEHVLGAGSGTEFTPTVVQGTAVVLSDTNTQVVIPFSGRFRVNFTGGWPVGAKVMELRQQRVMVEYGADGGAVTALEARIAAVEGEMPDDFLASAPLSGETLNLTLNDGTVIPADLSTFATDAALAAQIAAVLAAEEHAENITVAANGDVTVVDNNGAQIGSTFNTNNVTPGTYALSGTGPTAVPLVNGGVLNIDSSGLATDADVAAAVAGENFLLQPTISGTTITFPMQLGGSYALPLGAVLATVDEDVSGSGTVADPYVITDPDGDVATIVSDTDDQVVASSDGSMVVTPTTQADGQVDYDLTNPNPLIDPGSSTLRMSSSGNNISIGKTVDTHAGSGETTLGSNAGEGNTEGSMTAVGSGAARNNTGSVSSFYGVVAGENNTGEGVTFIGNEAGRTNSGGLSTAVGRQALRNNTGENSEGIGHAAGTGNTGTNSSFMGRSAGTNNSGTAAIGIGYFALTENTGNNVVSVGVISTRNNTGSNVTSVGYSAATQNIGDGLVAVGANAGFRQAGTDNTTVGRGAGQVIPKSDNTLVGAEADVSKVPVGPVINATADFTNNQITATGHGFGAVGEVVLVQFVGANPAGSSTFNVMEVVDANTLEFVNATITDNGGAFTAQNLAASAITNSTGIGHNVSITAPNQVVLGDTNVVEVVSSGDAIFNGTFYASDERLKKNFTPIKSAAALLAQLEIGTFEWDFDSDIMTAEPEHEEEFEQEPAELEDVLDDEGVPTGEVKVKRPAKMGKRKVAARRRVPEREKGRKQFGLIAQQVQKIMPEAVKERDGILMVDYSKVSVAGIAAIKELKKLNDELQERLDDIAAPVPYFQQAANIVLFDKRVTESYPTVKKVLAETDDKLAGQASFKKLTEGKKAAKLAEEAFKALGL